MTATRLLVKSILEKAVHYKWTIQGFGMLRLYLSPTTRIHVWNSRYVIPGVSDIHDHPWDFTSTIVAGELKNARLKFEPGLSGTYRGSKILCGAGAHLVGKLSGDEPEFFHRCTVASEAYYAGDSYRQHRSEVHQSFPADGTVTIVERVMSEDADHAMVYWPRNEEWVSAEPRPATSEEIVDITGYSLHRWFYEKQ